MDHDLIGRTLGQYRIVDLVGVGGMATVYTAHHAALDRLVALKVLPPALARDPEFAERFRREARAIAQLQHPNILPIYDFGQQDGLAYIVMQYVTGGTLADRLGTQLALQWCVDVCSQVARALDHAHTRNIVHRDVKPANVLLADGDWALLADFGIAKILGETVGLTGTGLGVGTPAYLSPEQGQGLPVDGRADLYSLGMMAYEMLVGRVAFVADTPIAVIMKHIGEPAPSLRGARPDLPPEVDRVVRKALAKQPDDRFATAGAFARALEAAADSPTLAHSFATSALRTVPNRVPPYGRSRPQPARGSSRPRRVASRVAALAAAVVGALLVIVGVILARPGDAAPGASGPTAAELAAAATATVVQEAAATEVADAEIAQAQAAATAEVAAEATAEAQAAEAEVTATAEAAAQQASLEATVQAAVQAAIAALPTTTPRPALPPTLPVTILSPGVPAGRLVVHITQADCSGISGVVTAGDRPVRDSRLTIAFVNPRAPGQTLRTQELAAPGSDFRIPFATRHPAGPLEIRIVASKARQLPSEPASAEISC